MQPDLDLLDPTQKARHRRYYCGLCHGVGVHVGHAWRGIHSHDAVFLATLVDGLVDAPAGDSRCRCPLVPVLHRPTRDPSSVALRFAVGAQLLLADQWVADKAEEGSRAARFARDVLDAPVGRGRAVLDELGIDLSDLDGFEQRQTAVETSPDVSLPRAAAPTAHALALLFARIAELPGGPAEHAASLSTLGEALGRLIYTIDALEDLDDDAGDGAFNPVLRDGLPDPARVRIAGRLLHDEAARAHAAVDALPFRSNADLVQATIGALVARGERALDLARDKATAAGRERLARWIAQPGWVHAAAALMTAWLALWSALSTTARAAPEQASQVVRTVLRPFLPRTQDCPCEKCGDGCRDCGEGCEKCGDGCKNCCDGCNRCGDDFGKCCEGFNDCMEGCTACCPK